MLIIYLPGDFKTFNHNNIMINLLFNVFYCFLVS